MEILQCCDVRGCNYQKHRRQGLGTFGETEGWDKVTDENKTDSVLSTAAIESPAFLVRALQPPLPDYRVT